MTDKILKITWERIAIGLLAIINTVAWTWGKNWVDWVTTKTISYETRLAVHDTDIKTLSENYKNTDRKLDNVQDKLDKILERLK